MFVRIVKEEVVTTIECEEARMHEGEGDLVYLTLETLGKQPRTYDIDKSTSEVYLMNNNGRTIDSFQW